MQFLLTKVKIKGEDSAINFGNIDTPDDQLGGISGLTVAGKGCPPNGMQSAFGLGKIVSKKEFSVVLIAIRISMYGEPIFKFDGTGVAWKLGDKIINKSYEFVGVLQGEKAYTLTGEYVAEFSNNQMLYPEDQYESGEPIFIIPNDRTTQNVRRHPGFDLSYRFSV